MPRPSANSCIPPPHASPLAAALLYVSAIGDSWGGGLQQFTLGLAMGTPRLEFVAGGGARLPQRGACIDGCLLYTSDVADQG
ncbi:cytochrome c biogenesis protein CcdA [Pseudomonas aeruginosa]